MLYMKCISWSVNFGHFGLLSPKITMISSLLSEHISFQTPADIVLFRFDLINATQYFSVLTGFNLLKRNLPLGSDSCFATFYSTSVTPITPEPFAQYKEFKWRSKAAPLRFSVIVGSSW